MSKPKAYIAGKISGLVYEDALRKFAAAETVLAELGFEPVNPMKHNGLDGDGLPHSWAEYMKRDIPLLLQCDSIYLLPDWMGSRGARLEHAIAHELGIKLIFAQIDEWIECQADSCFEKFIQTDPEAEVDLCPKCEGALIKSLVSPAPDSNSDRGEGDSVVNEQTASLA